MTSLYFLLLGPIRELSRLRGGNSGSDPSTKRGVPTWTGTTLLAGVVLETFVRVPEVECNTRKVNHYLRIAEWGKRLTLRLSFTVPTLREEALSRGRGPTKF